MRGDNRKMRLTKPLAQIVCFAILLTNTIGFAQEQADSERKTTEPVFRVSKLNSAENNVAAESAGAFKPVPVEPSPVVPAAEPTQPRHPLDQALEIAHTCLREMRSEVQDYTAILVKREQVNGVLGERSCMNLKVRCPRETSQGQVPFSVYMKFLTPRESSGREVIWVAGQNDNKLIAHEGRGIASLKRFNLVPTGWLAMKDNRYPIYDVGLENMIIKLIEKAERDKGVGPCKVEYRDSAEINKRCCRLIELTHDERLPQYEFHKAQVFVDEELQLPVRYAAYDWPERPGDKPKLIEEYTYVNIKLNVGLTAEDFNPSNSSYKFPRK